MKIVVCVKRVPDTESVINIDHRTKELIKKDVTYVLNPYDEFAVEEAILIKEKVNAEVVAIAIGPPEAEEILRTCLAMGADQAILITDNLVETFNSYTAAYIMAAVIRRQEYDLILCGKRSLDDDNNQFCPNLAEMLSIPDVSAVTSIEIIADGVEVIRQIEGGSEKVGLPRPCVLSAERGLNNPRLPSVVSVLKAKKRQIQNFSLKDIEIEKKDLETFNSYTEVLRYSLPKPRKSKLIESQKGLSAAERMKIVMGGGITQKTEANLLVGEDDDVVIKLVDQVKKVIS